GNNNALRTGLDAALGLKYGCKGEAPGASSQLLLKQFWRHGGFAMRRKADALVVGKTLHPLQIMFQRRLVQHRQRECKGVVINIKSGCGKGVGRCCAKFCWKMLQGS